MERIEQITTDLLQELDLMHLPIPVKKIIKSKGIKLSSFDLGEDVSGVLVIENGKARIGYSPSEPKVRQRFTLAHELGHFALHVRGTKNNIFVDSTKVMFRRKGSTPKEYTQEKQANSFAAALLMPKVLIKQEINKLNKNLSYLNDDIIIESLAAKFQVSEIAMTYRLMNLGYIHR